MAEMTNTKDALVTVFQSWVGKPIVVKGFYADDYTGTFEAFNAKSGKVTVIYDADGTQEDVPVNCVFLSEEHAESDEEIHARIERKYATLQRMVAGVTHNRLSGIIISGPGGLGKTFETERVIEQIRGGSTAEHKVDRISGHITPLALYERLYNNSEEGVLSIFDDCDSVFDDMKTLNILKAALDTRPHRIVSWDSRSKLMQAPPSFLFKGNIVFLTNKVLSGSHYDAFLTRVHHVDMHLNNREIMIRIRQIATTIEHRGATEEDKERVLDWMLDKVSQLKGVLSIRSMLKLLDLYLLCESDMEQFDSLATSQLID